MAFINTIRGLAPSYLADDQLYTKGAYSSYSHVSNAAGLHSGDTYSQQTRYFPSIFPTNTTYTFTFPAGYACPNGVWGYNHLSFGNYLGGSQTITPKKVSALSSLTLTTAQSIAGLTTGFNVLLDIFLTTASGDNSTNVFEIGIFHHLSTSAISFIAGATQKANMTVSDRTWSVAVSSGAVPYITIAPSDHSDALTGTIDIKAMLLNLVSQGIITGNEYFNGLGMGVETIQGAGSLLVSQFSVNYA